MKKRLLSLLLAVAVVMTYAASAFAATPADVKGTTYQSAVEELSALGVLSGYPDGTFKPTNTITRAELAKVVVVASGNESAATLMAKVKPTFKDVKANQWFTGFVNVAATKGLIKGDAGTKNFRPNDKIKFEEVVAVLIRALGYQDSKLNGAWPYNVILKAQDIGLLAGVDITAGTLATRGVVALLTSNTVNSDVIVYDKDGLAQLAGYKLVTKIGTPSSAVLTAPAVNSDKQIVLDGKTAAIADNFVVTGGKVLADLLGHKVSVLKKAGKVVAVTDAQDADKVVKFVNNSSSASDAVYTGAALTDENGKGYTVLAGATIYKNFVQATISFNLDAAQEATLFLNDDGKVQFVNVVAWTPNKLFVSYEAKTSAHPARVNLTGSELATNGVFNVADDASVTLDGKAASLADLKENDVVRYVKKSNENTLLYVEANRNAVSGKIEQVRTDATGKLFYTVAGKEYRDVRVASDALKLGDEFTFFLNKDSQIAGVKAINVTSAKSYVVLTAAPSDPTPVVVDGIVKSNYIILKGFSIKENKVLTYYAPAVTGSPVKGNIVELGYDADGKVLTAAKVNTTVAAAVTEVTSGSIRTATTSTYLVNSNTIYLNASQSSGDIYSLTTADKVTKGDEVAFVVSSNLITADIVVLTKDSETSDTAPAVIGTYKSKHAIQSATATTYFVVVNVNGTDKTVQVTGNVYNVEMGSAVAATYDIVNVVDNDAPFNIYDKYNAPAVATNVATLSFANNTFTAGGTDYILTSKSTVYVVDAKGNVSIGSINDVEAARAATTAGTFGTIYEAVYVSQTASDVGSFNEVGAVVVRLK